MQDRVYETFNYYSTLLTHKVEDFDRQFGDVAKQFRKEYQAQEAQRNELSTIFPNGVAKLDVKYKRGANRKKRAFTGREAAEQAEVDARQQRRAHLMDLRNAQNLEAILQSATREKAKEEGVEESNADAQGDENFLAGLTQLSGFEEDRAGSLTENTDDLMAYVDELCWKFP